MSYWEAIDKPAFDDLNISTEGPDTVARLICKYQLDVHFCLKRGNVSVWHSTQLDRVTTRYDEHGGAEQALEWAVGKMVGLLEKEGT